MVYVFELFKFRTLLTWIFETISMIISNEIWKFHVCVEVCAWSTIAGPRHLFPQFRTLLGLLYVVVIYRTSSVVKRAWPPWSQHLQNHYSSCDHASLMRRFADSEWHSHNAIELQTHPITMLGLDSSSVGSLSLRNANHEQLIPNSHPKHDCEITQHIWRQLHTIMKS